MLIQCIHYTYIDPHIETTTLALTSGHKGRNTYTLHIQQMKKGKMRKRKEEVSKRERNITERQDEEVLGAVWPSFGSAY